MADNLGDLILAWRWFWCSLDIIEQEEEMEEHFTVSDKNVSINFENGFVVYENHIIYWPKIEVSLQQLRYSIIELYIN